MEDKILALKNLIADFNDLSLTDFRDAFQKLVSDQNPVVDRFLVEQLKNFRGHRTMRSVIAACLAEREDENYLEDFSLIIEKETDVGLCKECITGLVRIATKESIERLEYLAESKPNAAISSLLRRELDKLKSDEKEPITYYLNHLALGNENARSCRNAAKVLIKMGDAKVVTTILDKFEAYDDLGRTESAKVISQLGSTEHLERVLNYLSQYYQEYTQNCAFVEAVESLDQETKEERIQLLTTQTKKLLTKDQTGAFGQLLTALEKHNMAKAEELKTLILEISQPLGLEYYLKSLTLIFDNKIGHANQYHEDSIRKGRVRHSRLRHLNAEFAYGIGKIGGSSELEGERRQLVAEWLTRLCISNDPDIAKLALYGCSYFVKPEDEQLLNATLHSRQLEGMTRLIHALERNKDSAFAEFFLKVAMEHQIIDIQEMAMKALSDSKEIFPKLRSMLSSEASDTKCMAIRIIGEIGAREFEDDLITMLDGQSDIIRIEAITALGKMSDPSVLPIINDVMYDAKSPVLIEGALKAISYVGGPEAISFLQDFAEKTRHRKTAVIAVRLLVDSHQNWKKPLPGDSSQLVLKHLKSWFEDRDAHIRADASRIAANIVVLDLEIYEVLKGLFKEAISSLRSKPKWDKVEMNLLEDSVRMLNRTYFFLKEMLDFQKELLTRCKGYEDPSSSHRVQLFEKLINYLENNTKFILSEQDEEELSQLIRTGLELGESSWREQSLLFRIAELSQCGDLAKDLSLYVKTVAPQAKAALMDALNALGLGLQEIKDLTTIKNVLVLEGSRFFRNRIVKHLTAGGYTVRHTDALDTAYAMVRSDVPDLIIMEITFKETCDGAAFAENMVKEYKSRISFIFSTNHRERAVMERVAKLKPKRIITKPYNMEELSVSIKG